MLKIGFTGTRKGMSGYQKDQLDFLLNVFDRAEGGFYEFHHGASPAGGADAEAEVIAALHLPEKQIIPHHPKKPTADAMLERDRDIANVVDVLLAAPETDKEQLRSGTWATVRYTRKALKPVIMLSRGE